MIDFAFVHSLKLSRFKKNNYDGTKEFYSDVIVKCYKEDKTTKVITRTGEEVLSKTNYFTTKEIGENDRIDGNDVISIEKFNIMGVKYYRSYV